MRWFGLAVMSSDFVFCECSICNGNEFIHRKTSRIHLLRDLMLDLSDSEHEQSELIQSAISEDPAAEDDIHYSGEDESEDTENSSINLEKFVEMVCKFIFYSKVKFNLSEVAANFLIRGIKIMIRNYLHYDKKFPGSIKKYSRKFHAKWKDMKKSVIICSSCWCTYPLQDTSEICKNEVKSKGKSNFCKNLLRQNGKPLKTLSYVPLIQSIKTVLCKTGIIEICIRSLQKIIDPENAR